MASIHPIDYVGNLQQRLFHLVAWIAFVLFNFSLLVLFLFVMWVYSIDSNRLLFLLRKVALSLRLEETWQMLSFFGVSGLTLLVLYLWAWRKIYFSFAVPYLFKTVNERLASLRSQEEP